MVKERLPYLAYLLRLWAVRGEGQVSWRASLERIPDGDRNGFADLRDLLGYLERAMAGTEDASAQPTNDGSAQWDQGERC